MENKTYLVKWEIDIEAQSPTDAAEKALAIQKDENSEANCFEVYDKKDHLATVDILTGITQIHKPKETTERKFPNGFESWMETHFEISGAINQRFANDEMPSAVVNERQEQQGHGGLYELSRELTDKFEKLHEGKEWGIDDDTQYFDHIEAFIEEELK